MQLILLTIVTVFYLQIDSVVGSYGVLFAEVPGSSRNSLQCVTYDSQYTQLPLHRDEVVPLLLQNFTDEKFDLFCEPALTLPLLNGSAVAVQRGNCSFSEKAGLAQRHGAGAVIVVSDKLTLMSLNMSLAGGPLNISVVMLSEGSFKSIMELGNNVVVSIYAPKSKRAGLNLLVIWVVAMITISIGAYWSGLIRHQVWLNKLTITPVSGAPRRHETDVELSPKYIVVAVVMMILMLLGLYFFYDYLVYFIIALFAIASCLSMQECLSAIVHLLPLPDMFWYRIPSNRLPILRQRPYVLDILLLFVSLSFGIWWIVERHSSYAWILQDILGVLFCIKMMTAVRLASLKTCFILLVSLFFYDIFFVFITPLFTKDGHSVMIDVATGGGSTSGEMLPMVFIIPNLRLSDASVCMLPYSLLGFGDILVPGLLVAFCHGFDLQVNSRRVYYLSNVFAYGAGLLVTDLALILMGRGQPALLYLVPFVLGTTFIVAWQRKEVKQIWDGKPNTLPDTTMGRSESSLSTPGPRDDDIQPFYSDSQFRHKLME